MSGINHSLGETFKQVTLGYEICIGGVRPIIEQVKKARAKLNIKKYELVKTPKGISLEGAINTGYKIVIIYDVDFEIEYNSCLHDTAQHYFDTSISGCEFVVMPTGFESTTPIEVQGYIEDIYVKEGACDNLYINATTLFVVGNKGGEKANEI
ncbi:MAG: hypothetical protein ACRCW2_16030 [Cellulosilyticaceae bacterium]